MIYEGIVRLVQGTPAVSSLAPGGGFMLESIPKDAKKPTWAWTAISKVPEYALVARPGLKKLHLQIDSFGDADGRGADCVQLSRQIDIVLSGFSGTLSDVDNTKIFGCFLVDEDDYFDDAGRTYRRRTEYEIDFAED